MTTAGELGRLLARVETVYADHGGAGSGSPVHLIARDCTPGLVAADEELLVAVLETLRRIAAAAERASTLPAPPATALRAALGGAELVMRAELIAGRRDAVPEMLPAFTYIATVPFLDRAEALRRSARVRGIVEDEEWRLG